MKLGRRWAVIGEGDYDERKGLKSGREIRGGTSARHVEVDERRGWQSICVNNNGFYSEEFWE